MSLSRISFNAFHTVNAIAADCGQALLEEVRTYCAQLEGLLSKTLPDSDVWRVNHAGGAAVPVSEHTLSILDTAAQVSRCSGGAFTAAIGAASALWRFTDGSVALPHPEDLAKASALCDPGRIHIDRQAGTVAVPEGMQLDLGGIAKGYIADEAASFLRSRGVSGALLNFGGNVVTVGGRPEGGPWQVGLSTPFASDPNSFFARVPCRDGTVVTSGVDQRSFFHEGILYHHLLDPRTAAPARSGVLCVTVIGQSSLLADAVSTACFVLGPREGLSLAAEFGLRALYVLEDGSITASPGFPAVFSSQYTTAAE